MYHANIMAKKCCGEILVKKILDSKIIPQNGQRGTLFTIYRKNKLRRYNHHENKCTKQDVF